MKMLDREITNKINWLLDNIVPPVIRDSKIFMEPLLWILFRNKRGYFMQFKENAHFMDQGQFRDYYKLLSDSHIQRKTDLNDACVNKILESIAGNKVLDIACGSGYLAKLIYESKKVEVTGIDIHIKDIKEQSGNLRFEEGNIEDIKYPDRYFDTVICTHTLEHVQDLKKAVTELRRVTKKRLIIIVPKQREYQYTFDLHLNFFPYSYSLLKVMGNKNASIEILGNDFFYIEDL